MNNITRRIIAGVSAAALFVSAVGSDALMGIFGREIYAVSATGTGKNGRSTGFPNLEQDTIGDNYNTGYGLHTNKTVTAVGDDGRTFDLDLESWYVGENPVDVATILDASGSMAWTVDTLEPLTINEKALGDIDSLKSTYGVTVDDLTALGDDYSDASELTKVLAAIQNKEENGGYLPQEIVDKILNPENTDNSKLSYSDYLYYIYEARSSVSEFVPLGYWDGYIGKISRDEDESLIGYYNFDESDKWKNLKSTTGGRMEEVVSDTGYPSPSGSNSYSGVGSAIEIGKKRYYASPLDIKPDYRGVKLDISPTDAFTISFAMKRKNDIKDWQVFKVGNSEKYFYIKSPDNRNNAITVRNQDGGGGTSGTANLIGTEYAFFTFVFYKSSEGNVIYNLYKDGSINQKGTKSDSAWNDIFNSGEKIDIIFDPCDQDAQGKKILYIDDIYVFDKALTEEEVANYFGDGGEGDLCESTTKDKNGKVETAVYHAKTQISDDTTKDIAQISDSLYNNPSADERAGWYYVNSHSNWNDIKGCLESGKQYLGIVNDIGLGVYEDGIDPSELVPGGSGGKVTEPATGYEDDNQSIATIPSVYQAAYDEYVASSSSGSNPDDVLGAERAKYYEYYQKLKDGNDPTKTFTPSANERSIQFYVDEAGYLRCFFCTGDLSWKSSGSGGKKEWNYSPRTFCSVVYVKEKYDVEKRLKDEAEYGNPTKYEELNFALNQFYKNLAAYSDLSNTATVRFSTHNLVEDKNKSESENTKNYFKSLIMKDWTNFSDVYKADNDTSRDEYLQDLLKPETNETSLGVEGSAKTSGEYPYVMTGGTYTWTGLKAFYDNMVKTKKDYEGDTFVDLSSGDTVYNIANDARDKYLIIFTDGRDNTQDYNLKEDGKPNYGTGSGFTKKDFVNVANYNPYLEDDKGKNEDEKHKVGVDDHNITYDGDLAEAWADKLKDEGYTIFCVMLATGSISPTANEAEYNRAKNFLLQLAGDKDGKRTAEDCISVVGEGDSTLEDAFAEILSKIQQPRNDYTVQDYIDPRFDLIGKAYVAEDPKPQDVIYHLGANGEITFTDTSNKTLDAITVYAPNGTKVTLTSGTKVDNIIDNIGKTGIVGLAYTPQDSYMVNRKETEEKDTYPSGYTDGDGFGTGYLYYDDEKDMYYLRWTDQIIPMENEAFDTDEEEDYVDGNPKYLDVWSATIRLKAKDDFIGGNNILTNGNEAGENLVYSDATIDNMDKGDNYLLYGFTIDDLVDNKIPYRKKLEALSGTNRKINAVDAGNVSQAVYGNGIDIPSSGFPRVTVNVRLLKLDAKDLSDVIYMGEVVSPTMMLADLENDYMTGSYYLQYLERYAYRVYGEKADLMPLIELLNKWLKINEDEVEAKTFTIPYIYLPDPEYNPDGTLAKEEGSGKVKLQNSTGWDSVLRETTKFDDLNLRDVTGFITYTWRREDVDIDGDGKIDHEKQQIDPSTGKYDITKEYVVKNTNQIKYNLQLKFTPLKEGKLADFELDSNVIENDVFFDVVNNAFEERKDGGWNIENTRSDYLKAMVYEEHTYEPHVMYDTSQNKWVLVSDDKEGYKPKDAVSAYVTNDGSNQTKAVDGENKVTDSGVYDWDNVYKPADGNVQLEGGIDDKLKNISGYYTDTPEDVSLLDASGYKITNDDGLLTSNAPCSLAANTTYTKDVVNAALALELFVDGKYLQGDSPEIREGKTYTFIATRYYDDPLDPLPYDSGTAMNADTVSGGKKYQLTFTVEKDSLPFEPKENQIYTVWAKLTKVEVDDGMGSYKPITDDGYTDENALPIGTYVISTEDAENKLSKEQFKIGTDNDETPPTDVFFAYLKTDSALTSYTYNRFPDSVYDVSPDAAKDTGDGEYLIKNGATDNSSKNIAENVREVTGTSDENQKLTFYFGTDAISKTYSKGSDEDKSIYTKDRLGIIILSKNNNSLSISKKVTHVNTTEERSAYEHEWEFTVTFKPDNVAEFTDTTFDLTWYKLDADGNWVDDTTSHTENSITFARPSDGTYYTATLNLKHNEKVMIKDLPEGTWQVIEKDERGSTLLYSAHNNMDADKHDYEFSNMTDADIQLNPASAVEYVNEFPYNLPSAGGIGTNILIYSGITFMLLSGLSFAILCKRGRSRDKPKG